MRLAYSNAYGSINPDEVKVYVTIISEAWERREYHKEPDLATIRSYSPLAAQALNYYDMFKPTEGQRWFQKSHIGPFSPQMYEFMHKMLQPQPKTPEEFHIIPVLRCCRCKQRYDMNLAHDRCPHCPHKSACPECSIEYYELEDSAQSGH